MPNINFVPDDYIQSNESRRANLMCLILFSVVMAALGGSFMTIKMFEDLQIKRKEMMRTALTTAELLEPIPRSVLLASMTNTLPAGVSLLKLDLVQKEEKSRTTQSNGAKSRYQAAQAKAAAEPEAKMSPEKMLTTRMEIEGIAPSDLQVAAYIERLGESLLVDDVALVESKEKKLGDVAFRQFRLTAMLSREVHLTKEDIDEIRTKAEHSVHQF